MNKGTHKSKILEANNARNVARALAAAESLPPRREVMKAMKPRDYIFDAARAIEYALHLLEVAGDKDSEFCTAIDHIVDEGKLQHIADRLRALAEEPVS